MHALLPYDTPHDATIALGGIPEGVSFGCYPSVKSPVPERLDEVEFYVLPYLSAAEQSMEIVAQMPQLQVVQTQTAGVETVVDLVPAGVTLCNAAGVHDASTAELAIALTLASGRHLDDFARNQTTGTWRPVFGTALADLRVLIVGYGRIGEAIERRLAGFEVGSITRVARRPRTGRVPVHAVDDLPDLLPKADVVIVIAPLTPDTEGMFDADLLARMPDGSLLVNVARGKLVDTAALAAETGSGRIRAALDVTEPEPLPADHPLWTTPGVLISPHVGGASSAFHPRRAKLIADQLRRYVAGVELENVIRR